MNKQISRITMNLPLMKMNHEPECLAIAGDGSCDGNICPCSRCCGKVFVYELCHLAITYGGVGGGRQ
jgi:hypothetical protein